MMRRRKFLREYEEKPNDTFSQIMDMVKENVPKLSYYENGEADGSSVVESKINRLVRSEINKYLLR